MENKNEEKVIIEEFGGTLEVEYDRIKAFFDGYLDINGIVRFNDCGWYIAKKNSDGKWEAAKGMLEPEVREFLSNKIEEESKRQIAEGKTDIPIVRTR